MRGQYRFSLFGQHLAGVRECGDLRIFDLVGTHESLDTDATVGAEIQQNLEQPSYQCVHRLPVVGSSIESVEKDQMVYTLSVQITVYIEQAALHGLGVCLHPLEAPLPGLARRERPRSRLPLTCRSITVCQILRGLKTSAKEARASLPG